MAGFLKALYDAGSVYRAATACGVSRKRCYVVREENTEFREAWDEALEAGIDDIESTMVNRARHGDVVLYKGQVIQHGEKDAKRDLREFDTTLQIFLMKTRRRNVYGQDQDREKSPAEEAGRMLAAYERAAAEMTETEPPPGYVPPEDPKKETQKKKGARRKASKKKATKRRPR